MQDVMERQSGALAAPERNVFEQYAEAAQGSRIVGDLLRFNKGDWRAGQDGTKLTIGTRLIAAVQELLIGWVRWEEQRPVEQLMGRVADGFRPAKRADLGHDDQGEWETDDDGRPKDPWQLTNTLILKEERGEQLYTLAGSSKGLIGAIGLVAGAYGKRMRQKPNEIPIVALEADEYKHKVYSWVKVPMLKVVGWVDGGEIGSLIAADAAEAEDEDAGDEAPFPGDEAIAANQAKGKGGRGKAATARDTEF